MFEVGILHLLGLVLAERVSSNGRGVPGDGGFEVGEDRSGDACVVRGDDLDGIGPVYFVSVVVLKGISTSSESATGKANDEEA